MSGRPPQTMDSLPSIVPPIGPPQTMDSLTANSIPENEDLVKSFENMSINSRKPPQTQEDFVNKIDFSESANRPPQTMDSLTSIPSSQVDNKAPQALDSLLHLDEDKSNYSQNFATVKAPQTMDSLLNESLNDPRPCPEQKNPPQRMDSLSSRDEYDSGLNQTPPTGPPDTLKSLDTEDRKMVYCRTDLPPSDSEGSEPPQTLKSLDEDIFVKVTECKTNLPPSKDVHCRTDLSPSAEKSKNNKSVVDSSYSVPQTVGKFVFDTLKISNFDPNVVSEADIKLYFENCIGDASSFRMSTKNRKIYMTFENPEVALDISRMDHPPLKVVPVEPIPPDAASCAVKLTGISSKHTRDYILLYFERVAREGSVETVHVDLKNNSAVVTVQNAGDIEPIMKARPYNMKGVEVNVSILQPQPPPRLHSDETEKLLLKVKYLPNGSTLREFQMYVEEAACCIIERWTRLPCKKKKTEFNAVLEFSNTPDYARVRSLVSRKPFQGHMISVQRISKTRCISVHPVNYSEEFLHMYFENPRRSGGCTGCVSSVKLIPDKEIAIVTFSKPNVLSTILQRPHKLNDQPLEVKPYYSCLESRLPYNEDLDASGHQCHS